METILRFCIFLSVLICMLYWERLKPLRRFRQKKLERFCINIGLSGLNLIVVRLLSGGGAFAMAEYAASHEIGLFHRVAAASPIPFVVSLMVLDVAIYFQHRLFHKMPLLWRFHKVHHSDPGFDSSTGLRFHTIEMLLSMYYKMALVLILGASLATVVVFEVILNACALFNHGNVRVPARLEPLIRRFVITPDMHRIHHSTRFDEYNSNFGFSVPWWDWLFQSYRSEPCEAHDRMPIGLLDQGIPEAPGFLDLLALPFAKARSVYNSDASRSDRKGLQ